MPHRCNTAAVDTTALLVAHQSYSISGHETAPAEEGGTAAVDCT